MIDDEWAGIAHMCGPSPLVVNEFSGTSGDRKNILNAYVVVLTTLIRCFTIENSIRVNGDLGIERILASGEHYLALGCARIAGAPANRTLDRADLHG